MTKLSRERDLLQYLRDELPRQIHPEGNSVLVIDTRNSTLDDTTQVEGDAVGCIGGSKTVLVGLETDVEITETRL